MAKAATNARDSVWPVASVAALLICFTLPPETSVSLGSIRMSPYRLVLIGMFFPALMKLLSMRDNPLCLPDYLMFAHSLWAALALFVTMGIAEGVETAGIYVFETFGAYLMARAYVRTPEDYAKVLKLVFAITASLLLFAVMESFTGVHLLRNTFKALLGGPGPHYIEPRLGLTRAFTSFEHPILYGVFAAAGFGGTYFVLGGGRVDKKSIKMLGVVAGATFFSLSGGPFTALALQIGLIAWDRLTWGIEGRWYMLIGLFFMIWVALSLLSNRSPVLIFISYLTFSANSAYNRVHIWDYGTAEVGRHPIFGIGLNDWIRAPWMSDSMDNYWLLTTVRYGVPAFLFLISAIILILMKLRANTGSSRFCKNAIKSWLVAFVGYALAGLTVHFWNALMVQFFFFIGCGMALVRPHLATGGARAKPKAATPNYVRRPAWT
ncbi:MAG: O-antigen ligase family protein [Alphaproteobacteria bacterium]|nr:O-antigen ligase family protein [Alphaproteobacteria bacterium]